MKDEIAAILKEHDGEARVWQTYPETWVPLVDSEIMCAGEAGMGLDYNGTLVESTSAARGAAFSKRHAGRCRCIRDVVDFGSYYAVPQSGGGPDLNNAVSTLVVRALPSTSSDAPKYWLRKVKVISLAEAFFHFRHAETFENIYRAWLEGRVVIRKRATRGIPSGKRKRAW